MEYWGELFLNEGFASYLEFIGAEAVQVHAPLPIFYNVGCPSLSSYGWERLACRFESLVTRQTITLGCDGRAMLLS
jgi:hypothetical protein